MAKEKKKRKKKGPEKETFAIPNKKTFKPLNQFPKLEVSLPNPLIRP